MELASANRATRQRAALSRMMNDLESFLSAQEIHARLRESGAAVGLTTVYRNLQTMAERGEVDVVRRGDGEAVFRRCETSEHHHHIVCRSCGFSVEIENVDVERWAQRAARRHGFSDVTHDLELFGVCKSCSASS